MLSRSKRRGHETKDDALNAILSVKINGDDDIRFASTSIEVAKYWHEVEKRMLVDDPSRTHGASSRTKDVAEPDGMIIGEEVEELDDFNSFDVIIGDSDDDD